MTKAAAAEQATLIQEVAESLRLSGSEGFIRFGGIIDEQGKIEHLCCVGTWYRLTENAATYLGNRLKRLRFNAPKRNNIAVRVYANFAILAKRTGDIVESALVLNHLHSKASHGISYVAPQRVIVEKRYPDRIKGPYRRQRGLRFVAVDIDDLGRPDSYRIVNKDTSSRWLDSVAKELVDYCYIPGFSNGKQIEMTYYEPL